jgi:hypothetical protein
MPTDEMTARSSSDHRAHQQAAVRTAEYAWCARSVYFILIRYSPAAQTSNTFCLPGVRCQRHRFAAVADIGVDVDAPVEQQLLLGREAWLLADTVTAVAVQQRRILPAVPCGG